MPPRTLNETSVTAASSLSSDSPSADVERPPPPQGRPPAFLPDAFDDNDTPHSVAGLHLSQHVRPGLLLGDVSMSMMHRVPSAHDTTVLDALKRSNHLGASSRGAGPRDGAEEEDEADPHAAMFSRTLRSAVGDAFGVIAADVWLHDERDGRFHPAPGGYYRHPRYQPRGPSERRALQRIEEPGDDEYVPPARQIPGAGLAGYFWTMCGIHDRACTWRSVAAIVNDPDQPPYPRMRELLAAGYGQATGVPFDIRGHRGVVLYLARATADPHQLAEGAHDIHLRASADLLGAVSAQSIAAAASRLATAERTARTLRRVRAKLTAILVFSTRFKEGSQLEVMDGAGDAEDAELPKKRTSQPTYVERVSKEMQRTMRKTYRQSLFEACTEALKRKASVTMEKSKGGSMQPPPPMPWWPAIWTFIGAFSTLCAVAGLGSALEGATGYPVVLGPFGALMTLQYGLTPAPASQPRNILYGQFVSLSLALLINLGVPAAALVRVPLTTALAIATMCKLGITHPPAGAAAAIFASSNQFGLYHALAMLLGNAVAIMTAVLINNLNDKRQYPIYYAFVSDKAQERLANGLEGIVPYFKRKREAREEQVQDELNMSMRCRRTEYHRKRSLR